MKFNFFKNKLQKKLFLIDSLIASILILIGITVNTLL
jgi:hypothetical protein